MKEWTIMLYLAGDNNLSEDMITALVGAKNAMGTPGADERVNVVAVYDSGHPTVATTHYHFTEKRSRRSLEACAIRYKHPQRKFRGRRSPGEKLYVIDFVRWAAEKWPAEKYALILSGHIHLAEAIAFEQSSGRPPQIISGNAGTALDDIPTASPTAGQLGDPTVEDAETLSSFGFLTLEPDGDNWIATQRDANGLPIVGCVLDLPEMLCGPAEPG